VTGHHGDHLVPLDTLPAGARARVRILQTADDEALLGLTGLGLLPGACVEVVRRTPALCLRLEGAYYAIDRKLARGILVEAEAPPAGGRHGRGGRWRRRWKRWRGGQR
jgi:Fe2+ transport system protein FeoA